MMDTPAALLGEQYRLEMTVSHEAYYWKHIRDTKESHEIYIRLWGGPAGAEMSFRWVELGETPVPQLVVFEDAWGALWAINERTDGAFLRGMARLHRTCPSANTVQSWLLSLGFKDVTIRVDPTGEEVRPDEYAALTAARDDIDRRIAQLKEKA